MLFRSLLWVEDVETEEHLTSKQREVLVQRTDGLQRSLYESLVTLARRRFTGSQIVELEEEEVEPTPAPLPLSALDEIDEIEVEVEDD